MDYPRYRLAPTILLLAALVGCNQQQSPQELKEKTAEATAKAKSEAKAVAEGIREGLEPQQATGSKHRYPEIS